jgi:hypothetical protein
VLAAASASISQSWRLVNSLGFGLCEDITFSTGRWHAANDGLAMILGLAVGAICAALWPLVQSAVSNATSEAFHSMGVGLYTKHKGLQKGWRHRLF